MSPKEAEEHMEAVADAIKPMSPEDKDAANEAKATAAKAAQDVQDAASTAKKNADTALDTFNTAKINENAAKEVMKGYKEGDYKKMKKDAAIKAEKLKPEALQAPWGTPAEVWTANMPENAINSLSQKKGKKDMKEHSLAQAKAED